MLKDGNSYWLLFRLRYLLYIFQLLGLSKCNVEGINLYFILFLLPNSVPDKTFIRKFNYLNYFYSVSPRQYLTRLRIVRYCLSRLNKSNNITDKCLVFFICHLAVLLNSGTYFPLYKCSLDCGIESRIVEFDFDMFF